MTLVRLVSQTDRLVSQTDQCVELRRVRGHGRDIWRVGIRYTCLHRLTARRLLRRGLGCRYGGRGRDPWRPLALSFRDRTRADGWGGRLYGATMRLKIIRKKGLEQHELRL